MAEYLVFTLLRPQILIRNASILSQENIAFVGKMETLLIDNLLDGSCKSFSPLSLFWVHSSSWARQWILYLQSLKLFRYNLFDSVCLVHTAFVNLLLNIRCLFVQLQLIWVKQHEFSFLYHWYCDLDHSTSWWWHFNNTKSSDLKSRSRVFVQCKCVKSWIWCTWLSS